MKKFLLIGILVFAMGALAGCDEYYLAGEDAPHIAQATAPTTERPLIPPRYTMPPEAAAATTEPWTPPPTTAAPAREQTMEVVWLEIDILEDFTPADDNHYRWAADIAQMRNHIFSTHPRFVEEYLFNNPEYIAMGQAFDAILTELLPRIPELTENEIINEMARAITAISGGGISMVINPPPPPEDTVGFGDAPDVAPDPTPPVHPFAFRWMGDYIYLVEATEDYAHVLNHRLTAINGITVAEMMESMPSAVHVRNLPVLIRYPENLHFFEIGQDENTFTLANAAGGIVNIIPTLVDIENLNLIYSRNPGELPRYMRRHPRDEWHERLDDDNIVYWRITRIQRHGNFSSSIERFIVRDGGRYLIIDLRNSFGWDAEAHRAAFRRILNTIPPENVFVLINNETRGQALGFAAYTADLGAIIIGQTSSAAPPMRYQTIMRQSTSIVHTPQGQQHVTTIVTPGRAYLYHSNIAIVCPCTLRLPEPYDFIGTLHPQIQIHPTINDWIQNNDPAFDYIMNRIYP